MPLEVDQEPTTVQDRFSYPKRFLFVAKLKAGPILQTKVFSSRRSNSTSCHGNIHVLIHSSAGASSRRWRCLHGTCGNWNVCLGLFAASQAAKARMEFMSVSQWSCVFTWASSRVALCWASDRGRLCRLHTASVRDDCLHAFLCDSGARLDAPCGFYDRVCYQKYTHRQHLARLEESARGDAGGDRHHQWAAGNSLVRNSELSCNGPEGKAQPCTPNSGCSLSQDASARLTRSQVANTDNKLCLFYQQETKKVKGSHQKLSNSVMTLAFMWGMFYFALRKEDERVILEVILNLSLPDLIVKKIIMPP